MRMLEIEGASAFVSLEPSAVAAALSDSRVSYGLKVTKAARFWRGVSDDSGHGMAVYGLGLYSTTSRKKAAAFAGSDGKVVELDREDLPNNPLRFSSVNDFQIWYGQCIKHLGFASKLLVGQRFPDFADFIRALDPQVDGIQIGSGGETSFVKFGTQ